MKFDAEKYWADKEVKVWAVYLHQRKVKKKGKMEVKYVRAKTSTGAIKTARAHTFMKKVASCSARLATPHELGCVPTKRSN